MKGPLVRECSEIWERGCFNELVAGPEGVSVCERAAAAQEADQTRPDQSRSQTQDCWKRKGKRAYP